MTTTEQQTFPFGYEVDQEAGTVTIWQGLRHVTLDESSLIELVKAVQS